MSSKPLPLCSLPATLLVMLCALSSGAAPPAAAASNVAFGYATSSSSGERDDFQYALIKRGHEVFCVLGRDNNSRAMGKLQDEVERTGHEVLYFAIGDREYVIRDTTLIARTHEIVDPMTRLGAEQGRLGSMQGDLGRRQGEMGRLEGEVGQLQGHLASLEARDDDRHRAELDELRQQLRELSDQVRVLSERQRALGAQQQELGRRQRELGEQQARASKLAFDQLRTLADKAVTSGKAERIGSY